MNGYMEEMLKQSPHLTIANYQGNIYAVDEDYN